MSFGCLSFVCGFVSLYVPLIQFKSTFSLKLTVYMPGTIRLLCLSQGTTENMEPSNRDHSRRVLIPVAVSRAVSEGGLQRPA